jgi:hypothetical protein
MLAAAVNNSSEASETHELPIIIAGRTRSDTGDQTIATALPERTVTSRRKIPICQSVWSDHQLLPPALNSPPGSACSAGR